MARITIRADQAWWTINWREIAEYRDLLWFLVKRDFTAVRSLMKKYGIPPEKVVLMPKGQDRDTILRRSTWLAELCKDEGCLFSTRLQVLLWGNDRGR